MKEVSTWTHEDLIDWCAGHALTMLIKGELRNGMIDVINVVGQWQDANARKKK